MVSVLRKYLVKRDTEFADGAGSGMRKSHAMLGSAIFFAVAPGLVAGLVPWWLTAWRMSPVWFPLRVAGALLTATGAAFLLHAFARFVTEGRGTPAPVAPTERLVTGGAYRYVRNPMYLAVLAAILGQALLFGRPVLLVYAVVVGVAVVSFVVGYEEPTLRKRYGAEYEAYRRAVPGWLPRLTPSISDETGKKGSSQG
jgi:protein-S-isoprenylcysteine O-methyltransferase Ste14